MNPALWHPLRWWRWQRAAKRSGDEWPSPALRVDAAPLLAIDLEMTGLDPATDEIVSIAWVPIDAGVIVLADALEVRLARRRRETVGNSATIHGLRDCDLLGAAGAAEGLSQLLAAVHARVAVFHHAPLDLAFLERALSEYLDGSWQAPVIDTLSWQRRRLALSGRGASNPNPATLEASLRDHGLIARSQHNALADALSCAELVLALSRSSRAMLLEAAAPPRC